MTACPACNTCFKVISEQLLLHHGMVRCGSCDHIFNANEHLKTITEGNYAEIMLMRHKFSFHSIQSNTLIQSVFDSKDEKTAFNDSTSNNKVSSKPLDIINKHHTTHLINANNTTSHTIDHTIIPPDNLSDDNTHTYIYPNQSNIAIETSINYSKNQTNIDTDSINIIQKNRISQLKNSNTNIANSLTYDFDSVINPILKTDPLVQSNIDLKNHTTTHVNDRAAIKAKQLLYAQNKAKLLKKQHLNAIEQPMIIKDNILDTVANVSSIHSNAIHFKHTRSNSKFVYTDSIIPIVLNCIMGLAGLILLLQFLLWARYPIMNFAPITIEGFNQVCQFTGCINTPAILLSPLSLDHLSLNKLPNNTYSINGLVNYQMQATIRNSSYLPIKYPDIELTIGTLEGIILARKILPSIHFPPIVHSLGFIPAQTDWIIDIPIYLDEYTVNYSARLVYQF